MKNSNQIENLICNKTKIFDKKTFLKDQNLINTNQIKINQNFIKNIKNLVKYQGKKIPKNIFQSDIRELTFKNQKSIYFN